MFMGKSWRAAFAALLAAASATAQAAPESIFINAKVFTADEARSSAQAFAVEQGRIIAIGGQADVLARKGPKTQIVDLEGKRVLPGLIDAHTHAVIAGLAELSPILEDAELDIGTVERRVLAWLEEGPYGADRPLVVFGVNPGAWQEPLALGAVFDEGAWAAQPLLLMGSDLHTAWANRAMRAKAGIGAP